MRRVLATILTISFLQATPFITSNAFAHGGQYRGPRGEVPPDSREPQDPPPPADPKPPATPAGDGTGPATGDGDIPPPTTPSGGEGRDPGTGGNTPPTAPGDGRGPSTSGPGKGRSAAKGNGFEEWVYWWNVNKDEVLSAVTRERAARRASTGGAAHDLGKGGDGVTSSVRASEVSIREQVIPALRDLIDRPGLGFDVRSACELGLAKIGDESLLRTLPSLLRGVGPDGKSEHMEVRESAALSYGLLGAATPEVREILIGALEDPRNGSHVRPFAAVSLGLLGNADDHDDTVVPTLLKALARKESSPGVKPSVLVGLGLLGDTKVVPQLLTMLDTGRAGPGKAGELDDLELGFVAEALGRIGAPGVAGDAKGGATCVVDALSERLRKRRGADVSRYVTQSSAIALGRIAAQCDSATRAGILETLRDASQESKLDVSTRHFALMSIGRLASIPHVDAELRTRAVTVLRATLQKKGGARGLTPPFAAVAMGLVAHQMRTEGAPAPEESIRAPLREAFADTRSPQPRSAYAIALGLAGDPLAVPALLDVLQDGHAESSLRGYTAVALGLIGDDRAREAVKTALAVETDRSLRVQTAIAAGLLADGTVVQSLVDVLTSGEDSQYILGSVSLALGQIGDERAVPPLVAIALDAKNERADLTRALAVVALGQIGDRGDVPALSRVTRDLNYRAPVSALIELLSIL